MNGNGIGVLIPATSCDTNRVFRCTECTIPTILICSHSHSHLWHLDARTHLPHLPPFLFFFFPSPSHTHTHSLTTSVGHSYCCFSCCILVCVIIPQLFAVTLFSFSITINLTFSFTRSLSLFSPLFLFLSLSLCLT